MMSRCQYEKTIAVASVLVLAIGLLGGSVLLSSGIVSAEEDDPIDEEEAAIGDVDYSGAGYIANQHEIVQEHPGVEFVWRTGQLNLTVNVSTGDFSGDFVLCGRAYNPQGERANLTTCTEFNQSSENISEISLSFDEWPEEATGNHSIVLEFTADDGDNEEVISERAHEVYVLEQEGDLTGDGLTNAEEVQYGTDFTVPDTVGNGLTDWEETQKYGTDPLVRDTTGDGIDDATLVRFGLDPTEPYIAYLYGGLGIVLFVLVSTVTVFGIRRIRSPQAPSADSESAATGTNSEPSTDSELLPVPDDSVLTNEEYITQMLKHNGGRMKQHQIVDQSDWSKAKVSRVLTELAEDGHIRKIKVGRENIIEIPEQS